MTQRRYDVPHPAPEDDERPGCAGCGGWQSKVEPGEGPRLGLCQHKASDHHEHMTSQDHPRCGYWWQPVGGYVAP